MAEKAFQDYYPDSYSHCYGCGNLNDHGLKIKSYWEGDETVARFDPKPYHTAFPGYVYGGLIASIIDCHATGSAAAAAYREDHREPGTSPEFRYVTASLQVSYLRPTPIDKTLVLKGTVKEIKGRKTVIAIKLLAGDSLCARGEVVCVQAPEKLLEKMSANGS